MSKILKNSSSQSSNVIYIKNIFINPHIQKKSENFPPIIHHHYKPTLKIGKYKNYKMYCNRKEDIDTELATLKKNLAKSLYSKLNLKKTRNCKENNKSCLNISQKNLIAVGYCYKPQNKNRNNSFIVYKNKSCSISRLKL